VAKLTDDAAEPVEPEISVLIVEDDPDLAAELAIALSDYGMRTLTAGDLQTALAILAEQHPNAVVLDQRLGLVDVVPRLPEFRRLSSAPILILSGNRLEADRIVALELGADDFLVKPISGRELVARLRAHLRRLGAPAARESGLRSTENGKWRLSVTERRLLKPNGEPLALTSAEFELLATLMEVAGQTVGRDTLTRRVLNRRWQPEDRSLDNLVLRLRQKFGPGGENTILTVRNQGYLFTAFPE
jgi:DNA-binding response OmpR family regulator